MSLRGLSIVTVLHESEADLRRLLASLDAHLPQRPELIVVDAQSTDEGPATARDWGATVIQLDSNPGFGPANNAGVARATNDVVALLNPLRTHRFAAEELQRTKTDAIDALGIARFAAQKRPAASRLPG